MSNPELSAFGENAVLLNWPEDISPMTHEKVLNSEQVIQNNLDSLISETTISYHSLAIYLKPTITPKDFIQKIRALNLKALSLSNNPITYWKIPVCYDFEFGLDLPSVMESTQLDHNALIDLHSKATYRIYFIGFLPGFVYLGGLNPKLTLPRKASPRISIPAGSVGIGGGQTGIYPKESPGGWQIIGRTPVRLFNRETTPPSVFKPGDMLNFHPINRTEFDTITAQIKQGTFQLQKNVKND